MDPYAIEQVRPVHADLGRDLGDAPFDETLTTIGLGAGRTMVMLDRPAHGVTLRVVADATFFDADLSTGAIQAPQLPAEPRSWSWLASGITS